MTCRCLQSSRRGAGLAFVCQHDIPVSSAATHKLQDENDGQIAAYYSVPRQSLHTKRSGRKQQGSLRIPHVEQRRSSVALSTRAATFSAFAALRRACLASLRTRSQALLASRLAKARARAKTLEGKGAVGPAANMSTLCPSKSARAARAVSSQGAVNFVRHRRMHCLQTLALYLRSTINSYT